MGEGRESGSRRAGAGGLHVAVVGGSIAGLASALALAQSGHRVTVLERDAVECPPSPAEAFAHWDRRGSPQTRHSHAFLARLHNLLRDRAPGLLAALFAHGATPLRFRDMASKLLPDATFLPEDDDITLIACRRLTFEWVLRRHVEALPGVELRSGVSALGLLAEPGRDGAPPRVCGVMLSGGRAAAASTAGAAEALRADFVVDASGRRTRIGAWLEAVGARPLPSESEPCGIFYSSRFYAVRDGAEMPLLDGPMGADLGYLKYGVFPGDARTFSVTLAASPDDPPFRALLRRPGFEALAATLPATQAWVDPDVAEPISDVMPMANLYNTRRFPVVDGEPLALGFACVGDALLHSNPIVGRGCSLAFLCAWLLADALGAHAGDLRETALALDAAVEREIVPFYQSVREQDRDAIAVNALLRRGEDPYAVNRADGSVDPKAMMRSILRDGFMPALREDITVLRAFMRILNLLDQPADLMKNPAVLGPVMAAYGRRGQRDPAQHGPSREAVLAELARLAA